MVSLKVQSKSLQTRKRTVGTPICHFQQAVTRLCLSQRRLRIYLLQEMPLKSVRGTVMPVLSASIMCPRAEEELDCPDLLIGFRYGRSIRIDLQVYERMRANARPVPPLEAAGFRNFLVKKPAFRHAYAHSELFLCSNFVQRMIGRYWTKRSASTKMNREAFIHENQNICCSEDSFTYISLSQTKCHPIERHNIKNTQNKRVV